jgi:hypothetical protein
MLDVPDTGTPYLYHPSLELAGSLWSSLHWTMPPLLAVLMVRYVETQNPDSM